MQPFRQPRTWPSELGTKHRMTTTAPRLEAIAACGLTKTFGDGDMRKTAVDGVDFTAHFGIRRVLKIEPFDIFRG
jgi:hypothetical protein